MLSWTEARAWRVRQHYLDAPVPLAKLLEVTSRICGLQAQVMSSAELTLWARIENLPSDAVDRALWKDRTLIKSWAMRGTLHLLTSDEFPMWQAAHGVVREKVPPSWFKYFELTPNEYELLVSTVADALEDGPATRTELAERVGRLTRSKKLGERVKQSWGTMLKPAAFRGTLCFAPSSGQNVRFTRPDRWLGKWKPADPESARLEATRRYLTAYAPSTLEDYARWFGTQPAPARRMLQGLGDEAKTVDIDGAPHWILTEHEADMRQARPTQSVRLLPAFDQYVLGAPRNNAAFLNSKLKSRVYRNQGWISPVLLVDGEMVGVWRHERKGSRVRVSIEPFSDAPPGVRRAADAEAERLASFLDATLELEWVTPQAQAP